MMNLLLAFALLSFGSGLRLAAAVEASAAQAGLTAIAQDKQEPPAGFTPIFNGKDLAGWKADEEAKKHWTAKDGVLSYDNKNKHLFTEKDFGNYVLRLEWRFPDKPVPMDHPVFDADGNEVKGPDGKVKTERMMDAGDSGIYVRGSLKAQANLFCYPCGSGEVWQYRTDPKMPPEVRRGVTPKKRADKPPGEWNAIEVTMKGDRMTVVLNGEEVISNAQLPGVPAKGPIGLQHEHGRLEFRNIMTKELAP